MSVKFEEVAKTLENEDSVGAARSRDGGPVLHRTASTRNPEIIVLLLGGALMRTVRDQEPYIIWLCTNYRYIFCP